MVNTETSNPTSNMASLGFRRVCSLASIVTQHRVFAILLAAYVNLFGRISEEASKLQPTGSRWDVTGADFLDLGTTEPLTRASVVAHARDTPIVVQTADGKKKRTRKSVMRQDLSEEQVVAAQEQIAAESEFQILERALHIANLAPDAAKRGELMSGIYGSLGNLHSAQGKYHQALHAMHLGLKAASDTADSEAAPLAHIALGQLELRHHRYWAAGTRFEDALKQGSELATETHSAALAGYGWAALMSENHDSAQEYFLAALGQTGVPLLQPADQDEGRLFPAAAPEACRPQHDRMDSDRVVALVGLGLVGSRKVFATGAGIGKDLPALSACAEAILFSTAADASTSRAWSALGLAKHVLGRSDAARQHHRRTLLLLPDGDGTNDLPAISHIQLNLGLVEFGAGNSAKGIGHVERLIEKALQTVPAAEVAEWMTRFARANTWAAFDPGFASELFGRAGSVLEHAQAGADQLAKHFVEQGLFLYRHEPAHVPQAIVQFRRASEIIAQSPHAMPTAEVAGLYSLLGAAHYKIGQVDEAIESYSKALELDRLAAAKGAGPDYQLHLMISHGNLAAMRLQVAGRDARQWHAIVDDFQKGRAAARKTGLDKDDPRLQSFEASLQNAMRLARSNGVPGRCPGMLETLLKGPMCTSDMDDI